MEKKESGEKKRRKKEDKKDGGKKKRIMNKGKKEKKKEGKKNTEFVTSRNWVVRFAILYYTYFSPLRVHLLSRLAYETLEEKTNGTLRLFKIKGWSLKLLERYVLNITTRSRWRSNSAIT